MEPGRSPVQLIAESEGDRQAKINRAEGDKQEAIARSEQPHNRFIRQLHPMMPLKTPPNEQLPGHYLINPN